MQTLPQPVKLTLIGPMFRYDRPQAGRYRQFWQFDVEAIGDPGPAIDAEIIELAPALLRRGGPARAWSCGSTPSATRPVGRPTSSALRAYFAPHAATCRSSSRPRLDDQPAAAARLQGTGDAAAHRGGARHHRPSVRRLRRALRGRAGAPRRPGRALPAGPRLVRGLDYYTRTTFEFFPAGQRGPAGRRWAVAAGTTGWSSCWAAAHPRHRLRPGSRPGGPGARRGRRASPEPPHVSDVVVGADPADTVTRLADRDASFVPPGCRRAPTWRSASWASSSRARRRDGAHFAVICGDELAGGQVLLRDLEAGTQRPVALADLVRELARSEAQHRHGAGGR